MITNLNISFTDRNMNVLFDISEMTKEEKYKIVKMLLGKRGYENHYEFGFNKTGNVIKIEYECWNSDIGFDSVFLTKNFIKNFKKIDSILYSHSSYNPYIRFLAELFIYVDPEQIKKLQV